MTSFETYYCNANPIAVLNEKIPLTVEAGNLNRTTKTLGHWATIRYGERKRPELRRATFIEAQVP
jgi:hypothetical protein